MVALLGVVLLGMGALAIDIGAMYAAQAELQRSADSAALAAASQLFAPGVADPTTLVRDVADEFARKNKVVNVSAGLSSDDVVLGRAAFNSATGKYDFQPGVEPFDAVQVTVRRTAGSEGGPISLGLAGVFGFSSKDLWAKATAKLVPRDIAVVIDLSASMNDDSELRHYKNFTGEEGAACEAVQINLRDCWAALNGPAPSRPYVPGGETETEYASDTGPSVGWMTTWGNEIVPNTYNPVSDPGLVYLPRNTTISNSSIISQLTSAGYSSAERSAILSGSGDGTLSQYRNRVAVMLGLATWKSGKSGGLYPSGGNGNNTLDASEMVWASYPAYRVSWTWSSFIDYVSSNTSQMYGINTNFRYRYGLKTYTNFLLESVCKYSDTNNLWQTPEQPLQAVKDAVKTMMDVVEALNSLDHVSLEIFASTASHEVNLTDNLHAVSNRLYAMQAGHYDRNTNIGGGIAQARNELNSSRGRAAATKIIVLMSDGKPNVDENGNYSGSNAGSLYALAQAEAAADEKMIIYTVSVGKDVDRDLMMEIAALGRGEEFFASGTPEEYTEQLEDIFRTLGGKRPVVLIE